MYGLIDCNNFYVSCERVFNPGINNQAVIVLSNNDGCVIARSNESKLLGLKMGDPYFKVRQFCKNHQVHVYSSNYALYADLSRRVMQIIQQHIQDVEIYSIDEAFVRIETQEKNLYQFGLEIKDIIKQQVGIPVSIGFAPTKVLAKIANHIAKKRTQTHVFCLYKPIEIQQVLSTFLASDIWGVGEKTAEKLKKFGIISASELCQSSDQLIRRYFNINIQRIIIELRGIPCSDLSKPTNKKTIVASRSFGKKVKQVHELIEAISCHAARASEKLRQQNSFCSSAQIWLMAKINGENKYFNAVFKFSHPTQDSRVIIKSAVASLKTIYQSNAVYKKSGIMLLELNNNTQPDMFSNTTAVNDTNKAMEVMDNLNQKMGKNTIFIASQGVDRLWDMRRIYCSPRYTTCWDELLKVR